MKKRFIKATRKDVIGTSFFAQITTSFYDLEKRLGPPRDLTGSGDWKTRAEWSFKTRSKKPTVITIYDYKHVVPVREVTTWHIGIKGDVTLLTNFLIEYGLCQ